MKRIGFTSGSFDPVTNGHLDVIERAARMVDTLVIGIGVHPGKTPLFSAAEKIEMLKAETAPIAKATRLQDRDRHLRQPDGRCRRGGRRQAHLSRGLRDGTDFDYEMQMAGMNGAMAPGIADGVSARQPRGAAHHRNAGAADRADGWRRLRVRLRRRGAQTQGQGSAQRKA